MRTQGHIRRFSLGASLAVLMSGALQPANGEDYVPAEAVFEAAFGDRWSDAHADRERALAEVGQLAQAALANGGDIWIADAGQSDFSADLVRHVRQRMPDVDTRRRVHVVQHSDWNESVTAPEKLAFVKNYTDYHRIADGNAVGNGTPGFNTPLAPDWRGLLADARLQALWQQAIDVANAYNGIDGRYHNASIAAGGLDFSDVAETCYIFGFEDLVDASAFFGEFGSPASNDL